LTAAPATDTMPAASPGWVNFEGDTWVSLQRDTTASPVRSCKCEFAHDILHQVPPRGAVAKLLSQPQRPWEVVVDRDEAVNRPHAGAVC
jgi:hypothetical protein